MTAGSILLPNGTTTVVISTPTLLTALVNYAPVASFISAMSGLIATITDTSSDPNSASAGVDSWNYAWNFGDGTTAAANVATIGNNQTHTYSTPGSYTISLLLTDQYNLISSSQSGVTAVSTPPSGGGGGGGAYSGWGTSFVQQLLLLAGDINHDGHVDLLDFNQLLVQWGMKGSNLAADVNHDGVVDLLDFNQVLVNWSK